MPTYTYRAKDRTLTIVEGTIEAESESAAITRLGSLGVFPLTIVEADAPADQIQLASGSRAPARPLAYMTRQLADLLSGGLALSSALSLLAQQTEHRGLRQVIEQVASTVRDGQALSDALRVHPGMFSPLYVSMVKAGETGGGLDAVLNRLADLGENEAELKSRVVAALVYPAVVVSIGVVTVIVLLTYVVPKLTSLFTETGQLLPLPTRILLAISDSLTQWWWLWIGGAVAVGWGARTFYRASWGRAMIDRAVLRLPLVGTLVRKLQTARLTRNVGVMIGQGVSVLQALEVASATVSHTTLRASILRIRDAVRGGESLSSAVTASGQFPAFVSHMISVGEESGTLEQALLKIAAGYERETDRVLRALTTALEPLLIVVVGLMVMFIVISMLLPIFQLGVVAQ